MVYDMFGTYCVDTTMNERIRELMNDAVRFHWDHDGQAYEAQVHPEDLEYFAQLIVWECARIARNANLEDVDGGDSAVLRAAGDQIEDYFGVEE